MEFNLNVQKAGEEEAEEEEIDRLRRGENFMFLN